MAQARFGPLAWDPTRGVITITVYVDDAPPPPNDGGNYSEPTGSVLTMEVPAKKSTTDPPTIIKIQTSPTGAIYTKLTWNGSAWANPVRINADGSPYTG